LSGSGEHRRWVLRWHRPARRVVGLRRLRWGGHGTPADGASAALSCEEATAGPRGPRPRQIERLDGAPKIIHQAIGHGWWLWWPCEACGGTKLPLRDCADLDRSNRARGLRLAALDDQPCPGCETGRRRLELAGAEPGVWYDASLGDWVVRVPCGALGDAALLPLEIRWFDASWAEVYRAASDLVYAHDAFEDSREDQGRGSQARRPG
jgi:hypothetical protein